MANYVIQNSNPLIAQEVRVYTVSKDGQLVPAEPSQFVELDQFGTGVGINLSRLQNIDTNEPLSFAGTLDVMGDYDGVKVLDEAGTVHDVETFEEFKTVLATNFNLQVYDLTIYPS